MLEKIYFDKPNNTDLNMYRCGMEDCSPGHSWGPAVRDHYIIHYVLDGKGIFQAGEKVYSLGKGDGFLISPSNIIFYKADLEYPWSYCWVGFHGLKAEAYLKQAGLTSENPVFRHEKDDIIKEYFDKMLSARDLARNREIYMLGYLHLFLSQLIENAPADKPADGSKQRKELYVKKAVEFIQMNYARKISIAEVSRSIGLDRSYLYSIFEEHLNISPQEFLTAFRMNKACELMQNISLSIGDVSRSVGYEDQLVFSKAFKKVKGLPPREYRRRQT